MELLAGGAVPVLVGAMYDHGDSSGVQHQAAGLRNRLL